MSPTTTITVASFQNAIAECADAIEASDWGTASRKYAKAEAINAGLELDVSNQGSEIKRRDSLSGLKKAIDAARDITNAEIGESRLVTTRTGFQQ